MKPTSFENAIRLQFDTLMKKVIDGIGKLFGQDWGISDWFQGVKDSILKLNLGQWAADAKEQTLKFFGETWSQLKTGWGEVFSYLKGSSWVLVGEKHPPAQCLY